MQLLNLEDAQIPPTPTNVQGVLRLTWGDITHINFDNNLKLRELTVIGNLLTSLSLTNHSALTVVEVTDSKLQYVEFDLPALEILTLNNNNLSNIDLSDSTNLTKLNLWKNSIESIDFSNNMKLNYVNLVENPLAEETISYLESIDWIEILEF